jgi:hypothetical protein
MRREHDAWPVQLRLGALSDWREERLEFSMHQIPEVSTSPLRLGQQCVCACQGADTPFHRGSVGARFRCRSQAQCSEHYGKRVLRPVV